MPKRTVKRRKPVSHDVGSSTGLEHPDALVQQLRALADEPKTELTGDEALALLRSLRNVPSDRT